LCGGGGSDSGANIYYDTVVQVIVFSNETTYNSGSTFPDRYGVTLRTLSNGYLLAGNLINQLNFSNETFSNESTSSYVLEHSYGDSYQSNF